MYVQYVYVSTCTCIYTHMYVCMYVRIYIFHSYLDDYNQMSKVPMKLVMFKFAIEHVSRISRVLKQDDGHVLCIGR